jgi:ribulose-5-phosphate 4-epimerase/fuculose-1-phosphate aldolase
MGLMATTPNIMKACPTRNSSDAEWQVRVDLAACYRLAEQFHWTDLVYTHISARVPGIREQFLINQFGLGFEEITASNLVRIDLDGNVVDGSEALIHKAGFIIHGAIHAVRPDAGCVIHTHSTAGIAISALADGLLPFSQHANLF